MRILQVVHDFLPKHLAGVEIYTDAITRQLTAEKNIVAILYSEVVAEAENYSLRRGRHGEIETFELVNNHHFESFEETYSHPVIERRVAEILDEFRPDIVHFQHLLNFSFNVVAEARRRGIPTVMTLHDHWLACANGGQRFHRELGRCDQLDATRCGDCIAKLHGVQPRNGRLVDRLPKLETHYRVSLAKTEPDEREAPEPAYIYNTGYLLDEAMQPTWVAHPPARLVFRTKVREPATFNTAVSMDPDTFEREGGGVRFVVTVNGEERDSRVMDPKRRHEDRTPQKLSIPVEPGALEIELRTEAVPVEDGSFCSAGWINPHLIVPHSDTLGRRIHAGSLRLAEWPDRLTHRRNVRKRWQAVRRVAEQIDLFITPSSYLRHEFIRFGFAPDKIIFADNGFVTSGWTRRSDLPPVARRFAFVGSLVKHKGMHVLLEAFHSLPPDAELAVCGSFETAPEYSSKLLEQCDHPGVRFLQQVPNDRIPALLAETDCLVVPSIWTENSPLTVHEAFLSGIPVIASRLGGHVDLLGEGGGLLYDADDPEDLARQLRRIYQEEGLLHELAQSIPEVKPMDRHTQELLGFCRSLLAGQRPVHTSN